MIYPESEGFLSSLIGSTSSSIMMLKAHQKRDRVSVLILPTTMNSIESWMSQVSTCSSGMPPLATIVRHQQDLTGMSRSSGSPLPSTGTLSRALASVPSIPWAALADAASAASLVQRSSSDCMLQLALINRPAAHAVTTATTPTAPSCIQTPNSEWCIPPAIGNLQASLQIRSTCDYKFNMVHLLDGIIRTFGGRGQYGVDQ